MDWVDHGDTFYDSWICRGMTGDMFIEIPQSGDFSFKHNLFWNDPKTKTRFDAKLPFQVSRQRRKYTREIQGSLLICPP
jgi:alpha-1,3-mannosyltransferase